MGAGVLPTCIIDGKIYFLFGKENRFADTPGYSDFGGGTERNESYLDTASREGVEESTGFFGTQQELRNVLKNFSLPIDMSSSYRLFIIKYDYNPYLELYYNNNQKLIQKKLPESVIKRSKIFEKSQIRWFCIDELEKHKRLFRSYFRDSFIPTILAHRDSILDFVSQVK